MRHANKSLRSQRAFTLLELMIVLGIVAIVAGLSYPAYVDYFRKSKRTIAKTVLLEVAARQEAHYFDNRAYTNNIISFERIRKGIFSNLKFHFVCIIWVDSRGVENIRFTVFASIHYISFGQVGKLVQAGNHSS